MLTILLLLIGIPVGVAVVHRGAAPGPVPTPPPTSTPLDPEDPELPSGSLPEEAIPAVVIAIVDGDTIDTDQGRVRVFGVDTPESGHASADQATAFTERLVPVGTSIYLWRTLGSDDRDQYGRLVRTVLKADGVDLGAELVSAGLATAFRRYSVAYVPQELEAEQAGRGIWSGDVADAPAIAPLVGSSNGGAANEPWNEPGPDLDCADIRQPVQVTPPDYHDLDRDGDGWACEWSSR